MNPEIPHHYTGRAYQVGNEWAWVIEDGGCIVMRGGGCPTEQNALDAMNTELEWLNPEKSS